MTEKLEFKFLKIFGQKQNQGTLLTNGTIQKRRLTVWLHKTLKIQVTKLIIIQYGVYFLGRTNCHVNAELIISLAYFSNHLPTAISAPY